MLTLLASGAALPIALIVLVPFAMHLMFLPIIVRDVRSTSWPLFVFEEFFQPRNSKPTLQIMS
jgi:hypothetical protein